jgi:riboflavin synthase
MFTGIIEGLGKICEISEKGTNKTLVLECAFVHELKIDQSLAHNGVCLTVDGITGNRYSVTAIKETLERTNLGMPKPGDEVNLERCMLMNGRIDGHIVQGHVDITGICASVKDLNGSWEFVFTYDSANKSEYLTVEKGSICINGVSLTVVKSEKDLFSVHIIPYTFENTVFKHLKPGDTVNLEFDIIGKYVARMVALRHPA